MGLTRDFKETVQNRLNRDPEFREELLKELMVDFNYKMTIFNFYIKTRLELVDILIFRGIYFRCAEFDARRSHARGKSGK